MPVENSLQIWFSDAGGDAEQREQAQASLREELREIPALRVEPIAVGALPEGAKAVDVFAAALLLPDMLPGVKLLTTVFDTLRAWVSRQPANTTIKVKLGDDEVEWSGGGPMPEAVGRFLDVAIKRHSA